MPCPFCMIASGCPPSPDPAVIRSPYGSAYPVLSTAVVVAFLDIAPLSRGHVLLCPRRHCVKNTEMTTGESAALGVWLPVLTRAVMKAIGASLEDVSWNVIQANGNNPVVVLELETEGYIGAEAGQTVPHSHFHIIPRVGDPREPIDMSDAERKNIALGEGPRNKLEDADGTELSRLIKAHLVKEIQQLQDRGDTFNFAEDLHVRTRDNGLKL